LCIGAGDIRALSKFCLTIFLLQIIIIIGEIEAIQFNVSIIIVY